MPRPRKEIEPEKAVSLRVTQEAIERYGQGFRAGYNRLNIHQRTALRHSLEARGITSDTFYRLLNGQSVPRLKAAAVIAGVFAAYGIDDPWGTGRRHVTLRRKNKEDQADGARNDGQ